MTVKKNNLVDMISDKELISHLKMQLELACIGYWYIELENGEIEMSEVFCHMLGYRKGDLEETLDNLKKIHNPEEWDRGWEMILDVLKGNTPIYENEIRYLSKDNKWIWCEVRGIVSKRAEDGTPLLFIGYSRDISEEHDMRVRLEKSKALEEDYQNQLEKALADIKTISGIVPICSSCKSIRNDEGYWKSLEDFIGNHSETVFTHGLCEECAEKLYKDEGWYQNFKMKLDTDIRRCK